jgi:hypothetical protein
VSRRDDERVADILDAASEIGEVRPIPDNRSRRGRHWTRPLLAGGVTNAGIP